MKEVLGLIVGAYVGYKVAPLIKPNDLIPPYVPSILGGAVLGVIVANQLSK